MRLARCPRSISPQVADFIDFTGVAHQSGQLSQLAHQFGGMKERISAEIRRSLNRNLGVVTAPLQPPARSTVDPDAAGLLAAPELCR
jgi:hypothetical protein